QQTLSLDEAGVATAVAPGLAWVACTTGNIASRVPVLIRPGHRPSQTFDQWVADQASLAADGTVTATPSTTGWLPALLDNLAPIAFAQGSGPLDYLWNDTRNWVGNPRNAAIEPTAIGTVLPESNNFCMGVQIINLPGRQMNVSLSMYLNTQG